MANVKPQTLKGFRDFLPNEARKRQFVQNLLKEVFESFGFEPLETPALEYEEVLIGKYGDEGDKLMYRFTDNGGRRVALRYDQTVPLARVVAEYQNQLPIPFKRYQIQPVWRAENTQKGRFREFLQCDIDIIGTEGFLAEAETISCVLGAAKKLGFKKTKMLINDRSVFAGLKPEDIRAMDKLKKIGQEGVIAEFIKNGYEPTRAKSFVTSFNETKPLPSYKTISEYLIKEGFKEGEDFNYDPTLARGLDYYTGPIFELVSEDYSAGSLGGGGRYNNLIGMFTDKPIPAVGFAFGFDRLLEALGQLELLPPTESSAKVLVTLFPQNLVDSELRDKLRNLSIETARILREKNINTDIWLDINDKLEKQLKYADQKGIPFAIIIGPEETKEGKVVLKNLKGRTQETITLDEVIQKLT